MRGSRSPFFKPEDVYWPSITANDDLLRRQILRAGAIGTRFFASLPPLWYERFLDFSGPHILVSAFFLKKLLPL
jgi:hypothetical protein